MKLIRPAAITDAALVSTTVPEADYAPWAGATTYAVAQRVIRTATHRVYECLMAHTSNASVPPENNPTVWLNVAPTNRWACFDASISTVTTASGSLSYTLVPGTRFGALALIGVKAGSVTVSVSNAGQVVYTTTRTLLKTVNPIVDYLSYWLAEFANQTTLVLTDLPALYSAAQVTITLTGSAIELGALVLGQPFVLGQTQRGLSAGITDYSRKETDAYGVTTLVQRAYSKRSEAALLCSNQSVDSVATILSQLRATPVVWLDESGFDLSVIFGYAKDWRTVIQYTNHALVNLTIEGLA